MRSRGENRGAVAFTACDGDFLDFNRFCIVNSWNYSSSYIDRYVNMWHSKMY